MPVGPNALEQLGLIGIPDAGGPWDQNVLQGYGFQPNPNVQARAEVPIGNIGNVSNLTQPLGGLNLSTDQSGDDNESSESEDGNTITESPKSEPVSSPADLRLPTVEYGDLTVHTQFIPTMRGLSCVIGGQTYRVVNAPADVTNDPQNRLFAGAATSTPVSSKTVGGTRRKSEKILGLSPREDLILAAKTRSELRQKEAEKQKKEATNLPDVDLNAVSFNVQKTPYRDNSRDKVKCQECEKRKRSASGQRSSSNSYQNRGRSPGNRDSGNSYQKRDNSYQNRGRSPGNRDSGNSYQKRDNSYQNRGRSPGNRDSGNSYQKRDNSYQNRGRSPGNRDSGNSTRNVVIPTKIVVEAPGNRDSFVVEALVIGILVTLTRDVIIPTQIVVEALVIGILVTQTGIVEIPTKSVVEVQEIPTQIGVEVQEIPTRLVVEAQEGEILVTLRVTELQDLKVAITLYSRANFTLRW
jgi:hypothetical protein